MLFTSEPSIQPLCGLFLVVWSKFSLMHQNFNFDKGNISILFLFSISLIWHPWIVLWIDVLHLPSPVYSTLSVSLKDNHVFYFTSATDKNSNSWGKFSRKSQCRFLIFSKSYSFYLMGLHCNRDSLRPFNIFCEHFMKLFYRALDGAWSSQVFHIFGVITMF